MSYATSEEYFAYSGKAPSVDIDRLLERASEVIDDHLRTAVYELDDEGAVVHTDVAAALRNATCAQVEFWAESHEQDDILGPIEGVNLGGMQVQMGTGGNRVAPLDLAPRAARILRNAGLYTTNPTIL